MDQDISLTKYDFINLRNLSDDVIPAIEDIYFFISEKLPKSHDIVTYTVYPYCQLFRTITKIYNDKINRQTYKSLNNTYIVFISVGSTLTELLYSVKQDDFWIANSEIKVLKKKIDDLVFFRILDQELFKNNFTYISLNDYLLSLLDFEVKEGLINTYNDYLRVILQLPLNDFRFCSDFSVREFINFYDKLFNTRAKLEQFTDRHYHKYVKLSVLGWIKNGVIEFKNRITWSTVINNITIALIFGIGIYLYLTNEKEINYSFLRFFLDFYINYSAFFGVATEYVVNIDENVKNEIVKYFSADSSRKITNINIFEGYDLTEQRYFVVETIEDDKFKVNYFNRYGIHLDQPEYNQIVKYFLNPRFIFRKLWEVIWNFGQSTVNLISYIGKGIVNILRKFNFLLFNLGQRANNSTITNLQSLNEKIKSLLTKTQKKSTPFKDMENQSKNRKNQEKIQILRNISNLLTKII